MSDNRSNKRTAVGPRESSLKGAGESALAIKPLCFVIGQIGKDGSQERHRANMLLKYIIKPALIDEYHVKRADEDARPGSITDQMILDIYQAQIVVADLSNLNANAFYELGVAHALSKKVIHMCDLMTELPFDIRDYRSVFFDPMDPDRHDRSILELKSAARALMQEEPPISPVNRAIGRHEVITKQEAESASLEQLFVDVDNLKRQVRQMAVGQSLNVKERAGRIAIATHGLNYLVNTDHDLVDFAFSDDDKLILVLRNGSDERAAIDRVDELLDNLDLPSSYEIRWHG